MSEEIRAIPPRMTKGPWNSLVGHGLEKTASFIIRSSSSVTKPYEAINGSTGYLSYSGSDIGALLNGVMAAMPGGGQILLKSNAIYNVATAIVVPTSEIYRICGEDKKTTVLKATASLARMVDGRDKTQITLENLRFDGNGTVTRGIDLSNTTSAAREHQLRDLFVRGCLTAGIDLTGAEDTLVERCRIHGDVEDTVTTDYGIILGGTGNVSTNGLITIQNCIFGFHDSADLWVKNIEHLRVFGCMFGSLTGYGINLKAQIVIDNAGPCEFFGSWFEGRDAVSTTPNILIENNTCRDLALYGCRAYGNRYPIIYSTVTTPNKACYAMEIVGGVLEPRGTSYAIQCPTYSMLIENSDLEVASEGTDVDLTDVSYYWIKKRKSGSAITNLNIITTNNIYAKDIYGSSGSNFHINYDYSTDEIWLGGGTTLPENIVLEPNNVIRTSKDFDLNDSGSIKNPKKSNTGSGAFAGSVKAMHVNIGGVIYYMPLYTTTGS